MHLYVDTEILLCCGLVRNVFLPCVCVCAVLKQQHDKMSQQQAIIQQAITQQSIRTAPWQQSTVAGHVATNVLQEQLEQQRAVAMEQIQQSEANLAAQYQSIMQQQQVE